MGSLLSIRVQKLFLIAVILKLTSATLGWYLQMQWSLGFALPLTVMALYIAIGLKREDRDVTDEKFADSCYYLGFIFTITSIVFSLLDLPQIGERIQEIAVRFGAAMISTVFGLIVRVYLVSFRPDSSDALKDAEDAVLEAAQKFREQLAMASEKFSDFQTQVTAATEKSMQAVIELAAKLSQDHSERMEKVFVEINERNQEAVTGALAAVVAASGRTSESVDGFIEGMGSSLLSLNQKVDTFGQAVTDRLRTTTFPDDYFAKQLTRPVEQLKAASSEVAQQVQASAIGAGEAAAVLSSAIRKLNTKVSQAEQSLDTVVRLTTAQHALFDSSATQIEQLGKLADVLSSVEKAFQLSTAAAVANASSNTDLHARVSAVVSAVEGSQKAVVGALEQVATLLEAERVAATSLASNVQGSEAATKALVQELHGSSNAAQQLAAKLEAETGAKASLGEVVDVMKEQQGSISRVLASLESNVEILSTDVKAAVEQLKIVTERLGSFLERDNPKSSDLPFVPKQVVYSSVHAAAAPHAPVYVPSERSRPSPSTDGSAPLVPGAPGSPTSPPADVVNGQS